MLRGEGLFAFSFPCGARATPRKRKRGTEDYGVAVEAPVIAAEAAEAERRRGGEAAERWPGSGSDCAALFPDWSRRAGATYTRDGISLKRVGLCCTWVQERPRKDERPAATGRPMGWLQGTHLSYFALAVCRGIAVEVREAKRAGCTGSERGLTRLSSADVQCTAVQHYVGQQAVKSTTRFYTECRGTTARQRAAPLTRLGGVGIRTLISAIR